MRPARRIVAFLTLLGVAACGGSGSSGNGDGGAGQASGSGTGGAGGAGGASTAHGGSSASNGGAAPSSSGEGGTGGPGSSSSAASGGGGGVSSASSSGSTSSSSASSSAASAGSGGMCGNVTCDTPPSPCYDAAGTCDGGQCVYALRDGASCDDGDPCTNHDTCSGGVCAGTAFLCDTPPAPSCIDANTLRTSYASTGTCSGGCVYAHTDVACSGGGCANGVCASGSGSVVAVSAGARHTCALLASGGVKCWGDNGSGQLGDGTTTRRLVPVDVQGLAGAAIAIGAGDSATCALIAGGSIQCWGSNADGALGDGTTTDHALPVTVQGLGAAATAIGVGAYVGCARVGDGVKCWGSNTDGSLGAGSTSFHSAVPLAVQGLGPGIAALSVGYGHSCAFGNGNVPSCWGFDLYGELGNPGVTSYSNVGVPATAFTAPAIAVTADGSFTCIVTNAGAAQCIGADGESGFGPVTPTGLGANVVAIAGGDTFRCAILSAGKLMCWGDNYYGQIGDGVTPEGIGSTVDDPTVVKGLASGVVQVSTGQEHACAITSGGHLKCWGYNATGQLGNNSLVDTNAPVDVIGF